MRGRGVEWCVCLRACVGVCHVQSVERELQREGAASDGGGAAGEANL